MARREAAEKELDDLQKRSSFLRELASKGGSIDFEAVSRRGGSFEKALDKRFREILRASDLGPASSRSLREALIQGALLATQEEWENAQSERESAENDELERYERRIAKLMGSLEKTQSALQELSQIKEGDEAGIASIYRTVQGLDMEDVGFERKQEMLSSIFRANLALQKSG